MKKRVEFKIIFKNGSTGYYTYLDKEIVNLTEKELDKRAKSDMRYLMRFKAENAKHTIFLKDCMDDKKTLIDISEVVTIGYSLVEH